MARVSPTSLFHQILVELAQVPLSRISTDMPEAIDMPQGAEPFVQAYHLSGDVDLLEQSPEYDVFVYARGFRQAEGLALRIEDALVRYPLRVTIDGRRVVVDSAFVTSAAKEQPWDIDPSVTRFHGSYSLATRG